MMNGEYDFAIRRIVNADGYYFAIRWMGEYDFAIRWMVNVDEYYFAIRWMGEWENGKILFFIVS
jgi:hypothetical protein